MVTYMQVVFGIPLTQKVSKAVKGTLSDPKECYALENALLDLGFVLSGYEGLEDYYVGDQVGYLGVELDHVTCLDPVKLSSFNMEASLDQRKEAMEKIDNLPPEIKKVIEMPDVLFVFYTC